MWRKQRDFEDEIRAHLELEAEQLRREGVDERNARLAARQRFGNVGAAYDRFHDSRQWRRLDNLTRDVHFAARSLAKTPAFTVAAALALALGIGATTAMLSVVRSVLLAPLPYANADRLVVALHDGRNPVAPANFADWRAQTRGFTAMAAAEMWSPDLTGDNDPEQISGLRITSAMLPMLGVSPLLGRMFTSEEDQPGNEHVVILSYGLWQRRFAASGAVLGKSLSLDGKVYTIIGVMPKTFQFAPFWQTHAELWAPLALTINPANRGDNSLRVFARLKPSVTLAQARRDLAAVTARLEREYPGSNQNVVLTPLKEKVVGNIRTPLIVLLVAVALVLLIACANVAHMLLARGATRHRELAVRTALGATRSRLIAQMLVESVLLATLGGVAGFGLAVLGVRALVAANPAIIPRVANVRVDGTVMLITLGITAFTAIAFGLLPAFRGARIDLAESLRDGDRASSDGRARARMRGALVASEFALALVLLVGAGLMIRSFIALQEIDPGFDPRNVISMIVSTNGTPAADSSRHQYFYIDALARLRALPGITSASFINHRPFDGDMWGFPFHVEGRPVPRPGESPTAMYRVVFPGYFATMRIPILRGRDIAETDRLDAPAVVVINEYMAKTLWPGEDPIGKRITAGDSTWMRVVGVTKNDVRGDWAAPPDNEIFLPFFQRRAYMNGTGASRAMTLVARVSCDRAECDAGAAAASIRAAIRGVEHNAPISAVRTMTALANEANAEPRFNLVLLTAFAVIAVVLAAVGIYGVMSYSVSRRTHEIGIRIALGAEPSAVMRSVVGRGIALAGIGAAAGLALAFPLTQMMQSILYGVRPTDAVTFSSVTLLLLAVALVATVFPARRATRADPLIALRTD